MYSEKIINQHKIPKIGKYMNVINIMTHVINIMTHVSNITDKCNYNWAGAKCVHFYVNILLIYCITIISNLYITQSVCTVKI